MTGKDYLKRVSNFIDMYNLEDKDIEPVYDGIVYVEYNNKIKITRSIHFNITDNAVEKEELKKVIIDLNPPKETKKPRK